MAEYPEHEKLRAVADKSQVIGEFILEFLAQSGIELARRHEHTDECHEDGGRHRTCGLRDGELWPCGSEREVRRYMAAFFRIDEDKLEAEKQAMLDALRAANGAPR